MKKEIKELTEEQIDEIVVASRLFEEMKGDRDEIWREVEPYLIPGNVLKARYAYADLWEARRGKD